MTDLNELASQVEALTEPCRETDAEILAAIGTHVLEKRGSDREAWWYEAKTGKRAYDATYGGYGWPPPHPRFTASLDAAMSLVPEGCCVSAMGEVPDDYWWYVNIWEDGEPVGQPECRARTAALALTAAALRALTMENDHD